MRGELVMNIFSKIKNKLISLFRPAKNQHRPTEHGNIIIEKQPEEDEIRQIENVEEIINQIAPVKELIFQDEYDEETIHQIEMMYQAILVLRKAAINAIEQIRQSISLLPFQELFDVMQNLSVALEPYRRKKRRIEHLAKHARKRRVRKKNRHRLLKYESRRQ